MASVKLEADYDLGLGVLTESRDFNNHETSYRYDPFGRISSITKPGDSLESPTESYDYQLGMSLPGGRTINWIETRQRETAGSGTVDSRMFFDGLSRKIMRRAEGEDPSHPFRPAHESVLVLDGDDSGINNFPDATNNHGAAGWHWGFADGHVHWVSAAETRKMRELAAQ